MQPSRSFVSRVPYAPLRTNIFESLLRGATCQSHILNYLAKQPFSPFLRKLWVCAQLLFETCAYSAHGPTLGEQVGVGIADVASLAPSHSITSFQSPSSKTAPVLHVAQQSETFDNLLDIYLADDIHITNKLAVINLLFFSAYTFNRHILLLDRFGVYYYSLLLGFTECDTTHVISTWKFVQPACRLTRERSRSHYSLFKLIRPDYWNTILLSSRNHTIWVVSDSLILCISPDPCWACPHRC